MGKATKRIKSAQVNLRGHEPTIDNYDLPITGNLFEDMNNLNKNKKKLTGSIKRLNAINNNDSLTSEIERLLTDPVPYEHPKKRKISI